MTRCAYTHCKPTQGTKEIVANDAPLADVIGQGDVLEEAVNDGSGLEGGRRLLNGGDHVCECFG